MTRRATIIAMPDRVTADRENVANHSHYMISAALDVMESTFGNPKVHEEVIGKRNTFYVPPDQIDLIFYLLYECAESIKQFRSHPESSSLAI